jgi:hypothetical protein
MRRPAAFFLIFCLAAPVFARRPVHARHAMVVARETHASSGKPPPGRHYRRCGATFRLMNPRKTDGGII